MFGTESGDFNSSMAVENCKEEDILADAIEYDSVLHVLPPS